VNEPEAEEAVDDSPGAPQVFDPEELRAKIAKLPIAFGQANKQVATEADLRDLQNVAEMPGYQFPGLDLLEEPEQNFSVKLEEYVREQAAALESALQQYRIEGHVVEIESGPVITLYHVALEPGTKVAALSAVASDIARSLKAVNIRIVSNMAGRDTVGVEVPNSTKEKVRLKELMSSSERFAKMKLPMFLGKDASGEPLIADLAQMPHMLIAGTDRLGQVGVHEHDHHGLPLHQEAQRAQARAGRSQDGRDVTVQGHPAPHVPGRHRNDQGRGDPGMGLSEDG
jgi:S-DNA-T family DNA segregation ATPase FtsK/SpoIIIE